MLTRSKDSQMDKAKRTLQDIVRNAQQVAGNERLRADVGAALAHGSKATDQLRKDIQAGGGIYARLAADKKLRKNLRAMLDLHLTRPAVVCGERAIAFATSC